jgi:hypothetical protein
MRTIAAPVLTVAVTSGRIRRMSVELHIFLRDSQVRTVDIWQAAIDQAGFPTALDRELNVQAHTGFLAASYKGKSTGFEFDLGQTADILAIYPHIARQVDDRGTCATFRWGGDFLEMSAALSAAASLARLTDGIYFYPDDDIIYDADEAMHATRRDLDSVPI